MIFAMRTHTGRVRRQNEDSSYIPESGGPVFIAVADGMGGHNAGDKASSLAIETLRRQLAIARLLPAQALVTAVKQANSEIFEQSLSASSLRGMGTTVTAAVFDGDTVYVANVGDSRAYLLSGDKLRQLTVDHSLVEELISIGRLTREGARTSPQRNIITRALGADSTVNVDIFESVWSDGDVILLCTDGLTAHLGDQDIFNILSNEDLPLDERAEALISTANERGGHDNISVALALNGGVTA